MLESLFLVADNQDSLDALMFVVCGGSKAEHGPQVHRKQKADQCYCLCTMHTLRCSVFHQALMDTRLGGCV
jgi:hypothetical protein